MVVHNFLAIPRITTIFILFGTLTRMSAGPVTRARGRGGRPKGSTAEYIPWTPAEEERLINAVRSGEGWAVKLALFPNRTKTGIQSHIKNMKERGIDLTAPRTNGNRT